MKYMLLLPLLTIGNLFTMNIEYRLDSSETITKNLWDAGFNHFAEESKMGALLGNKAETPIMLSIKVDALLKKYKETPHEITFNEIMNPHLQPKTPTKNHLMLMLLKDHPRAIQALENNYNGVFLK